MLRVEDVDGAEVYSHPSDVSGGPAFDTEFTPKIISPVSSDRPARREWFTDHSGAFGAVSRSHSMQGDEEWSDRPRESRRASMALRSPFLA